MNVDHVAIYLSVIISAVMLLIGFMGIASKLDTIITLLRDKPRPSKEAP